MVIVMKYVLGVLKTNTYIVYDEGTGDAILIDAGGESGEIIREVKDKELKVRAIIATHGHFDHIYGIDFFKKHFRAPFYIHKDDLEIARISMKSLENWGLSPKTPPKPEKSLEGDALMQLGSIQIRVVHTPGHTPGSICIHLPKANILFSGDTIFKGAVGRTDFIGGSREKLEQSLRKIYQTLPRKTMVYPGHGPSTTLEEELRENPLIQYLIMSYGE